MVIRPIIHFMKGERKGVRTISRRVAVDARGMPISNQMEFGQ